MACYERPPRNLCKVNHSFHYTKLVYYLLIFLTISSVHMILLCQVLQFESNIALCGFCHVHF